jgi:hypothetical protein
MGVPYLLWLLLLGLLVPDAVSAQQAQVFVPNVAATLAAGVWCYQSSAVASCMKLLLTLGTAGLPFRKRQSRGTTFQPEFWQSLSGTACWYEHCKARAAVLLLVLFVL